MSLVLTTHVFGQQAPYLSLHSPGINTSLQTTLWDRCYFYPHITGDETEPQRGDGRATYCHNSPLGCRQVTIKAASDIIPLPRDAHYWHLGQAHYSIFPYSYVCKYRFYKQNWKHAVYAVSCVLNLTLFCGHFHMTILLTGHVWVRHFSFYLLNSISLWKMGIITVCTHRGCLFCFDFGGFNKLTHLAPFCNLQL